MTLNIIGVILNLPVERLLRGCWLNIPGVTLNIIGGIRRSNSKSSADLALACGKEGASKRAMQKRLLIRGRTEKKKKKKQARREHRQCAVLRCAD